MNPTRQSHYPGYMVGVFLIPAVIIAVVLVAALTSLFQYSFRETIPGSLKVGDFTLGNFGRMSAWIYLKVFLESLMLAGWTALFNLLLGYPLALALVRSRSRTLKAAILIATVIPMFSGDIVRTYSWLIVLGKNGFINGSLGSLGLIASPFEFLYTPLGVTLALVQYSMPVMVLILAAAISHINPDYEKAASSLGASPWRVFVHITLPLSRPGIISGSVTIFAWTLSAFATPQLIGGGKVNMIANLVYQLGFSNFDFPFAATLSMTALALTLLILAAMRLWLRRFETVETH